MNSALLERVCVCVCVCVSELMNSQGLVLVFFYLSCECVVERFDVLFYSVIFKSLLRTMSLKSLIFEIYFYGCFCYEENM